MDRRSFIVNSAAGAALTHTITASSTHAQDAATTTSNKRPRVGLIGCGWYGKCDLFRLLQVADVEVVSLCDVDAKMLEDAANQVAQRQKSQARPRTFKDYREMLKAKDLDICLIATPDHWHALPMIEAVKAGADVYVQKPISIDVTEGQAMVAAARKYGRVVQVGTQRRSTPHLQDAKREIVETGKLGKVGLIEVYCYYHMRGRSSQAPTPAPEHLDFDMWTGPAPLRAFHPMMHPRGWRAFNEFSNGIVGDMCIHMLDMVRWIMNLGWPTRITSVGGVLVQPDPIANISDTQVATFDFAGVPMVWQHRTWGSSVDPQYPWGATIYGDAGTLKLSVNSFDFTPQHGGEAIHRDVKMELEEFPIDKTEKDLERHVAPAIRRHMQDFLAAIATRGKPIADIEQGYISTTSCILANLSMQLGRTLEWDPEKQQVVGDDEANRLLTRPYRAPWTHPTADTV